MAKETFTIKRGEEEILIDVQSPNGQQSQEAKMQYCVAFAKALDKKAMTRDQLESKIKSNGIWGSEQEAEFARLNQEINKRVTFIAKGNCKLSEAKQAALEVWDLRRELNSLLAKRIEYDEMTAEGIAENAKFDYLVSVCTVYNSNGERYFKDVDDYLDKAANNEPVAVLAPYKIMNIIYGNNSDIESSLPENKFLRKWKYVDQDLRLINKDGHYIDREGKLVNKDGRYVDENDNFVDKEGNKREVNGNLSVEDAQFLDDDGNPITVDS